MTKKCKTKFSNSDPYANKYDTLQQQLYKTSSVIVCRKNTIALKNNSDFVKHICIYILL